MNKVILVYPKLWPYKEFRLVRLPLPILAVSRLLYSMGYEIILIDMRLDENWKEIIDLHARESVCVGISSMTGHQVLSGLEVSRYVKEKFHGIPTVWGGWHPTMLPEQTVQNPFVDIVVKGQGEITFKELVQALVNGGSLENIPGIVYKTTDNNILSNCERELADVNRFPEMPFELIEFDKYFKTDPNKTLPINSSTGCPYKCGFCCVRHTYGRKWNGLDAGRVVAETVKWVEEAGINLLDFVDTNFFINTQRTKAILSGFIENKIHVKWWGSVRADQVLRFDDRLMQLMVESGCSQLFVGAESGSNDVLTLISKEINTEHIEQAVLKLKKWGIPTICSFMVGFPPDPFVDMRITLDFIKHLMDIYPGINIYTFLYTPTPGTPLFDYCRDNGLVIPDHLEGWGKWEYSYQVAPWVTDEFVYEFEAKKAFIPMPRHEKESFDYIEHLTQAIIKEAVTDFKGRGNSRVIIYGASETGKTVDRIMKDFDLKPVGFVDRNTKKVGTILNGTEIFPVQDLERLTPDTVIIASLGYQEEIYQDLKYLEDKNIQLVKLF